MSFGHLFNLAFTALGWLAFGWCAGALIEEREKRGYAERQLEAERRLAVKLEPYKPAKVHHFRRW